MDDTERVIEEFCCKACYYAKHKPCTCRCGGKYHGKGKAQIEVHPIEEEEGKRRFIIQFYEPKKEIEKK